MKRTTWIRRSNRRMVRFTHPTSARIVAHESPVCNRHPEPPRQPSLDFRASAVKLSSVPITMTVRRSLGRQLPAVVLF